MSQGLKKLIFNLCDAPGTSGQEPVDVAARELRKYAEVRIDHNNNVIGELGNPDSHYHIMLDAHLDAAAFIRRRGGQGPAL